MKRALKLFSESGDDRGEGIASLEKIKINNPLAGFNKKFENSYDGIQINYKDGSKITMDPRKFLVEAAGTAAGLKAEADLTESLQKAASSADSTAASRFATTTSAKSNADNLAYYKSRDAAESGVKADARGQDEIRRRQATEANISNANLRTMVGVFSNPNAPQYIVDDTKRSRIIENLANQNSMISAAVDANLLGIQDDPKLITQKRSTFNSMKNDLNGLSPSGQPFAVGPDKVQYIRFPSGNVIRLEDYNLYNLNMKQYKSELAPQK